MPGMATSSGSRTIRSVNGSARVSRSTSEPGERDPAVADADRLDPAEPAVARERRDPSGDEHLERHRRQASAGSASSAASPSRSSPAPSPSASATRAFVAHRWPTGSAPARTHVAPPPGKAYAGPGGAGRAAAGERDRDPGAHRPDRRGEQARVRVPGTGRGDDDPVGPGRDRRVQQRAVHRDGGGDEMDAFRGAGRGRHRPSLRAPPQDRHLATVHPPERPAVRAGERRQRRGVHLERVVRGLDRAAEADHDAGAAHRADRRRPGPRRAGWPDRRSRARPTPASRRSRRPASVPRRTRSQKKRGLLDRVRALDDDRAIDGRIGQRPRGSSPRCRAASGT